MRRLLVVIALLGATTACGTIEHEEPGVLTQSPSSSTEPEKKGPSKPRGPRGESAPDFTVTTFTGGRFALGEQRGTPVVLNFWESW